MIDLSFITATIIKQPIIYHQNWMLAGYIFLSGTVVIHSEFLDNYLRHPDLQDACPEQK